MFEEWLTRRRLRFSPGDPWQRVARTSLVLLLLILVISPVTQNVWSGDNFLHGHDTESSLILGLTMASVAVLRMRSSRIDIDETLRRFRDLLSAIFSAWLPSCLPGLAHGLEQLVSIPHSRGRPAGNAGYQLPILV